MWSKLRKQLETPTLQDGFDHWASLERDNPLPKRSSFDPSELPPHLLPHIVMLEVSTEPLDFRYRVIGDQVLRYLSNNHTGEWVSNIAHQAAPRPLFKTLADIVSRREPALSKMLFFDPGQDYLANTEIIFPLCLPDGQISRLLVFIDLVTESELV